MTQETSRARALLAEALELPHARVPDDAAIGTIEAWDSLAHMRLVQGIEEALRRELTPEEIVGLAALGDIERLLATTPIGS